MKLSRAPDFGDATHTFPDTAESAWLAFSIALRDCLSRLAAVLGGIWGFRTRSATLVRTINNEHSGIRHLKHRWDQEDAASRT
jgi:hypothetical protein